MTQSRFRFCGLGLVTVVLLAVSGASASPAMGASSLLAGAGDIACDPDHKYFNRGYGTGSGYGPNAYCKQLATSNLLRGANTVFMLGDSQYEHSSYSNLRRSYARSWGRYLGRTRPAIGNHEYGPGLKCVPTSCSPLLGVGGYFDYFGSRAGPRPSRPLSRGPSQHGYYSYNVGASWHVVVLNSMCWAVGGCGAGSPQHRWLERDLAANRARRCILAYWHHPPFSSGQSRGYPTYYDAFWRTLHGSGADVVLAGHDHVYERFGRQDEDGSPSKRINGHLGPREFMVGTGGKNNGKFVTTRRNSQKRIGAHGVLRLRLDSRGYVWRFARIYDGASLDRGSAGC